MKNIVRGLTNVGTRCVLYRKWSTQQEFKLLNLSRWLIITVLWFSLLIGGAFEILNVEAWHYAFDFDVYFNSDLTGFTFSNTFFDAMPVYVLYECILIMKPFSKTSFVFMVAENVSAVN